MEENKKPECDIPDSIDDAENPTYADLFCKNCGSTDVVQGFSIPLCQECRQRFTKYPIPTAIKIFSAIIIAIMTFSLFSFPESLKAGIAFERGLRAETGKKFITAAKEYEKAVEIFPNSFIACGKLFVAYVKNHQFVEAEEAFNMINGKESSNSDEVRIIDEANAALGYLDQYYNISEGLIDLIGQYSEGSPEIFADKLKEYTSQNHDDYWGLYYYSNILFDLERYDESKAASLKALSMNADIYEIRLAAASAYRQTGEFDKAIEQCNIVLEENVECVDAYAALSKIDLKRHQYEDALGTALHAYSLDNNNYNAVHTLALAYHFNGMYSDRDSFMTLLKQTDQDYYNYTMDIIEGRSRLFD